jgi:hypothetical protein
MKTYGSVDVWIHVILTSALVGGEWSASRPGRFTPGERAPGIYWIRGWLGYRVIFDQGVKRQEHEAGHSDPSSAEVKNGGAIPPLLHTSSWCCA